MGFKIRVKAFYSLNDWSCCLFMVRATLTGLLEHLFKKFSKAKSCQSLKVKRESLQA